MVHAGRRLSDVEGLREQRISLQPAALFEAQLAHLAKEVGVLHASLAVPALVDGPGAIVFTVRLEGATRLAQGIAERHMDSPDDGVVAGAGELERALEDLQSGRVVLQLVIDVAEIGICEDRMAAESKPAPRVGVLLCQILSFCVIPL